jgi:hypothetical protein
MVLLLSYLEDAVNGIILDFHQLLNLVGKLDDSPGEGAPREKFRQFLEDNIKEVGQLRDYIEVCCRTSGPQYNRALQDLVNFLGTMLGFEVVYGRYAGIQGDIGFDGLWTSPEDLRIVVEVKTTDAYTIKTATLVGYVDDLISSGRVPDWGRALGLYVVGRPDSELRQLENAIIAEKRISQLRIASVESMLSLAEVMSEYDVDHSDILEILRPTTPTLDPVADVLKRVAAQSISQTESEQAQLDTPPEPPPTPPTSEGTSFFLTPVQQEADCSVQEVVKRLVGDEGVYAFGENTAYRKQIKAGDWICFYGAGVGVIAHAKIVGNPHKKIHVAIMDPDRHPWLVKLSDQVLYMDEPVVLDADLRTKLEAFKDRDASKPWSWFVQSTNLISKYDFEKVTRG